MKFKRSHLAVFLFLGGMWMNSAPGWSQTGEPVEGKATFDFSEAKAVTLFRWFEQQFQVVVVAPPKLSEQKITLRSAQAVGIDQAYDLLVSALTPKGHYAMLDKKARVIDVVPFTDLYEGREKLRRIMNPKPGTLVDSQEVVWARVEVEPGTAQMVRTYLLSRMSLPRWVNLETDPARNGLEIVASVMTLKQVLEEIVKAKEVLTKSDIGLRQFNVRFAKAKFAFQMLVDYFKLKEKGEEMSTTPGVPSTGGANDFLRGPTQPTSFRSTIDEKGNQELKKLPSASGMVGTTQFQLYLDESNSLITAMAPGNVLVLIEQFLRQFDVEPLKRDQLSSLPQMGSFAFNYIKVETAVNLLASLFQSIYGESSTPTNTSTSGTPPPPPDSKDTKQSAPPPPPPQVEGTLTRDIKGRITFIANTQSNTVVVLANQSDLQLVEEAVKRFDLPSSQVLIEVSVMEAALTDDWQVGLAHLMKGQLITGQQTGGGPIGMDAKFGHDSNFVEGFLPSQATAEPTAILLTSDKLQSLFKLLSKKTKLSVLSAPKIIAQNNRRAQINVTDNTYWIRIVTEVIPEQTVNGTTTPARVITNKFVEKIPTGLNLSVTPKINDQNEVFLDVTIKLEEISGPPLEANFPPITSTRDATVSANVKQGETIVIGGIVKNSRVKTEIRTPLLSDVPLIGALFSNTIDKDEKRELVLFLTPYVLRSTQDARNLFDLQQKRHHVVEWPTPDE